MRPTHIAAAAAFALSLISASSAARADWDIDMTMGATVASPTSTAPTYIGPRLAIGLRYVFAENHALGIVGRGHILFREGTQEDLNASLSYRYFWRPSESVNFLIGASAGIGWWPECVHTESLRTAAESCGGIGAAMGAELGTQIPVTEDIGVTFGAEFIGRLAASDIKGMMMMPGGWAGIYF